jgi:prepilin-type N-terminal cleavage/methylation domain-containing protein
MIMNKKNNQKGFTLIETMIAVSLFVIVVMIGMGSLINANAIHRKSEDARSILDNLSFILEDMSRNLRTGYDYHCFVLGDTISSNDVLPAKSCANGFALAFEHSLGDPNDNTDQWVYYFLVDTNNINNPIGRIWKSTQGGDVNTFIQLTTDEINIDLSKSGFAVLGAEAQSTGDTQQPLVGIRISGTINSRGNITPFSLQTSASQRLIDIQ